MRAEDDVPFTDALRAVYELRGKEITPAAIKLWWGVLGPYSLEQVSAALAQITATSRYLPTPAEVVDIVEPWAWPTAGEAWALVPKDERETGAVCDEMQGAWASAAGLYEAGDVIGARRAFERAWDRIVNVAVSQGKRRPSWRLSLGWDERGRAYGAQHALSKGLLSHDQVAGYIEHGEATGAIPDLRKSGRAGDLRHVSRLLGWATGDGAAGEVSPGAGGLERGEAPADVDA